MCQHGKRSRRARGGRGGGVGDCQGVASPRGSPVRRHPNNFRGQRGPTGRTSRLGWPRHRFTPSSAISSMSEPFTWPHFLRLFQGVGGSRPRRPLFPRMQPQMLPQRARRTWHRAVPARRLRVPEQARGNISPQKIVVTCESPVGDISVVTLIRTDTTLDHSQKAEKV